MKQLIPVLILLSLIASAVAVDISLGEGRSNAVIPYDDSARSIDVLLLDSPKIQSLLLREVEKKRIGSIPVIVIFYGKLTASQKSLLDKLVDSFTYEYSLIDASALSVSILKLDELAALPFVKNIEYDADTRIVLAQSTTQIGASRVWLGHGAEGNSVKVAVLDTGIDTDHPDLKNIIKAQDFTGEGIDDEQGHGTHVASIIAGSGESAGGINKGVAPKAHLFNVKVLGRTGAGKLSDTIAGIEWAVLNDANVISMSLGAQIPCNGLDATSLASDAAVKRGVHVVVAAGNTGPLPASIGSPGCAREVITVGAVDRLDTIAPFSSRGPTLDGRVKPDIVAPGVLIFAAKNGGGYIALSGTSMATPHVSGVIALLLSEKPGLSPQQIKTIVMSTARDVSEDANSQGAGRIEAYDAFIKATGLQPQEPPKKDETKTEEPSDSRDFNKKNAEEKSKKDGHVDVAKKVDEFEYNGSKYYIVEGSRNEAPSVIVRVWVNQDTGNIDRVQKMSFVGRVWIYIIDFFNYIQSLFT